MSHEILSVKLYELDKKIGQLHSRIAYHETADYAEVKSEVDALRRECRENAMTLRHQLKFSRAPLASRLAEAFDEVEQIITKVKKETGKSVGGKWRNELSAEEKILLAEYALDFALQAANHALLISMEAIKAQMAEQEQEDSEEKEATE